MNKPAKLLALGVVILTLLSLSALTHLGQTRAQRFTPHASALLRPEPAPSPKFQLDCTLEALTTEPLAIDKGCGNTGKPASKASALQNEVKNRFCLPGSPVTPIDIDFQTLSQLQTKAKKDHIHFGRKPLPDNPKKSFEDLPTDRGVLIDLFTDSHGRHLGEGTLVRLEGFVFKAQHSNTFVFKKPKPGDNAGESVNCNQPTLAMNDIHIALAETQAGLNGSECDTVTAEITPHHRSDVYNRFDTNPKDFLIGANGKKQKQKKGEDKLAGKPLPLSGARIRITGQLFFDASHSAPCHNGKGAPKRASIWEVHPVFAIEVFEVSKNKFIPFEKWVELHDE
jgi:hypothetical protein